MENLLSNVHFKVNDKIYLKDPENSELGKKILVQGHIMIDDLGFEAFTFKKLAQKINTTESSVYRYFESKHHLLNYCLSWYWSFQEYRIFTGTANLKPAEAKLRRAIELLCETLPDRELENFNLKRLQHLSINENSKAYLVIEVDSKNKDGFYLAYKKLCKRFADILSEINPKFSFPNALASTVIEGINLQKFYAKHLPSLSNVTKKEKDFMDFFYSLAINSLQKKK